MRLYDHTGKPHQITWSAKDSVNGYDEPSKHISIAIDGENILGISVHPSTLVHPSEIERSTQRYLDGLHHPTHYKGQFAYLAKGQR